MLRRCCGLSSLCPSLRVQRAESAITPIEQTNSGLNPSGCSDEDDDDEDDDDGGDKDDDDGDDDDDDDEENDDNEDDDDRSSMNYSILRISSTSPDAPTAPRFLIPSLGREGELGKENAVRRGTCCTLARRLLLGGGGRGAV